MAFIMSNEREQLVSTRSNSFKAVLRPLVALTAIVVVIALVVRTWNDTGAATGEIPMRIFLVGWAAAAVVISAGFVSVGLVSRPVLPLAVQHVAVGLVIGLAVGTTDWTTLHLAGWWQLWWTVPLLLVYAGLLITLRRSSRTRP
jgi:hypothetical protein